MSITREQAADMIDAHAEGLHSPPEIPREGCPECEGRELRDYPPAERTPGDMARRLEAETGKPWTVLAPGEDT